MDIFKLGDKILDLLNVIFAFWNNQVLMTKFFLNTISWKKILRVR